MKKIKIIALLMLCMNIFMVNTMFQVEPGDQAYLEQKLWNLLFFRSMEQNKIGKSMEDFYQSTETLLSEGADPNCISSINYSLGVTPLMFAVSILDLDLVELLLKYKANINLIDPVIGVVAVHKILDTLQSLAGIAEHEKYYLIAFRIFDILIQNGADLDAINRNGISARDRCLQIM